MIISRHAQPVYYLFFPKQCQKTSKKKKYNVFEEIFIKYNLVTTLIN